MGKSKQILLSDVVVKYYNFHKPPASDAHGLLNAPALPKLHGSTAKGRGYNFSLTEIKEMKKKIVKEAE